MLLALQEDPTAANAETLDGWIREAEAHPGEGAAGGSLVHAREALRSARDAAIQEAARKRSLQIAGAALLLADVQVSLAQFEARVTSMRNRIAQLQNERTRLQASAASAREGNGGADNTEPSQETDHASR